MEDYEYSPQEEQLRLERRQKRIELKRKRHRQKQLTLLALIVIILGLALFFTLRSCGGQEAPPPVVEEEVKPETVLPDTKPVQPDVTATLAAVGDIMAYGEQVEDATVEGGGYDFLPAMAQVATYLTGSDITVGNFEANFAGEPYNGYPGFSAPPELATTLSALGFDILQTANTYSIQNGLIGLQSTAETIRNAGMNSLGTYVDDSDRAANQVVVKDVDGMKFAFIAMTKGLNNMTLPTSSPNAVDLIFEDYYTEYSNLDTGAMTALVEAAKATEPDVIVAMVHWGNEYDQSVANSQTAVAEFLGTQGVDVILGTHPHVLAPQETITVTVDGEPHDVFVAYSLGNFLSSQDKANTRESSILRLEFTKDGKTGETTISNVENVAIRTVDNGEDAADRFVIQDIDQMMKSETDPDVLADLGAQKTRINAVVTGE